MYNKLSASYQKKRFYGFEDEPPEKKLVSDADIFIKKLSEKQCNTKTNLQEQLATNKEFYKAAEFRGVTSYTSGSNSLEDFNAVVKSSEQVEKLQSCGLTEDEIELFFDHQRGYTYLSNKHKNINEDVLKQQLDKIFKQIQNHLNNDTKKHLEISRRESELMCEKPTSLETKLLKFALENQQKHEERLPHPMDDLKDIENQMTHNTSPVNVKKIRRKARSLQKQIDNISSVEIKEPYLNKNVTSSSEHSKWDIKSPTSSQSDGNNSKKVYTCKPQNYYTIRGGQIIKINQPEDIKESKKFSVNEIKQLPKFENYSPGNPHKTLFLKNIARGVSEEDLINVFEKFTKENILSVKIMKGKMRGQAFVETENKKAAENVLSQCNGMVLRDKPIIIQFGNG